MNPLPRSQKLVIAAGDRGSCAAHRRVQALTTRGRRGTTGRSRRIPHEYSDRRGGVDGDGGRRRGAHSCWMRAADAGRPAGRQAAVKYCYLRDRSPVVRCVTRWLQLRFDFDSTFIRCMT